MRRRGKAEYLDLPKGTALGVIDTARYATHKLVLKRGDAVFLYTDGITEAMNSRNQLFSEARLKTAVDRLAPKGLPELLEGVKQQVAAHVELEPQSDDITMVALRYNRRSSRPAKED